MPDARVPAGGPPVDPPAPRRRDPEWPLALVLAVLGLGLGHVAAGGLDLVGGGFRVGTAVIAAALLLAALLRAVLPDRRAGLLVVRSRVGDVLVLLLLGAGLAALAVATPATG